MYKHVSSTFLLMSFRIPTLRLDDYGKNEESSECVSSCTIMCIICSNGEAMFRAITYVYLYYIYIFTRSASECLSNLSFGDRENLGFREYRFRQNNDKYVCDYGSREASDEEHRTRTYRIFMEFLNAFNADSIDLKNNRRKDGGRSHSPCLANREHLLAIIRLFLSKHHRKMSVQKNTWLRDRDFALEYIFNRTRFLSSISKLLCFILKRRVNVSNQ